MEITQEHLNKQFSKYFKLTKDYFDQTLDQKLEQKLEQKLDQKLARFASKDDLKIFATKNDLRQELKRQTKALKAFAEAETMKLARAVQNSVVSPMQNRFDVIDKRFNGLDNKFDLHTAKTDRYDVAVQKISKALRIKLSE